MRVKPEDDGGAAGTSVTRLVGITSIVASEAISLNGRHGDCFASTLERRWCGTIGELSR